MLAQYGFIRAYIFPILLISAIVLGGWVGFFFSSTAKLLKPLGDIFLNLIFTTIVPLVFFSIASSIARISSPKKLGKIIFTMFLIFLLTGTIAALLSIVIVLWLPPAQGITLSIPIQQNMMIKDASLHITSIFTVSDFSQLLSHQNMLPLILFSLLVGFAASTIKNKHHAFVIFLQAGEDIFMRVFSIIMYYAPIGFFCYFAVLVSELGPQLMQNYFKIAVIYYVFALIYFITVYSCYAYFSGKIPGIKSFWRNIFLPMLTAIATCSSAASIPANLTAAKKIGIAPEIYETTIPLGTMIHKEGSIIGGIIKIAFLFGLFHLDFKSASALLTALGISLLVGSVMGAIPSGGMLGELLILNAYGFPSSALMIIAAISIIIDPLATMLNVTGNTASTMLIARLMEGRSIYHPEQHLSS
jgi:Na+/H+-dicarboxylate symporter